MNILKNMEQSLSDIWHVFSLEMRRIFTDSGVILVFFVAGLVYPFLFNLIYQQETVLNVPVAIVDDAQCDESKRFARKLDATPEMEVTYRCSTMAEAESLMRQRRINGIIYFPRDYGERLARLEQATVAIYSDMSSFLYYKSVLTGSNMVMLDEMKQIQFKRYSMKGITGERAAELVSPVPYDDVKLFMPGGGFTSFLIPALLILVIHQTLFFGIGMLGGTAREDKLEIELIPEHLRGRSVHRVIIGRALAYYVVYAGIVAIDLFLVPYLFRLPQVGRVSDMLLFLQPFMFAAIFFAMTFASLLKHRESGILTMVFFSIILLFLSGMAWPRSNIPVVWRVLSYLFPSTHGIQGFIRISTLGATLQEVRVEYIGLCLQTVFYFITATWAQRYINRYRPIEERMAERRDHIMQRLADRRTARQSMNRTSVLKK